MIRFLHRIATTSCLVLLVNVRCGGLQYSPGGAPSHPVVEVTCPDVIGDGRMSVTSRVLSEIYTLLNLTTAVVIKEKGHDVDTETYEAESDIPTIVSQYEVNPERMFSDIHQILGSLNQLTSHARYFIVSCSLPCIVELLEQVNTLDATGPTQGVLTHLVRWVVLLDAPAQLRPLEDHVGNITHVTAIVEVTNDSLPQSKTTHRLYSALWTRRGRRFEEIGSYQSARLHLTSPLFPNTNYGFNNRTFTVTVNMWGPFISKHSSGNTTYYEGLCIDMLETLSSVLNFSYIIVEVPDGKWGNMENGTWQGIVAQLKDKAADISLAPLAVSTLREKEVDFSFPFYLEYTAVLYGRTQQKARQLSFFFQPFHWIVWALLGLAMLLTAVAISRVAALSLAERRRVLRSTRNSFWFTMGAFFNQSSVHIPTALSTRLVMGFFWFFCTVLVATYGANLVAFLTVAKPKVPFSTLEELSQQQEYTLGTIGSSIWEEMLELSTISVYQRIWERIQYYHRTISSFNVLDQSLSMHLERARQGDHAFVTDITTFELERQKSCDIAMMEETFLPLRYAIAVQNNSAYKEIISATVMRVLGSGLIDVWRRKHWPKADKCSDKPLQMARGIAVEDLLGIFFSGLGLLGLGALLLGGELLIFRAFPRGRSRRTAAGLTNALPAAHTGGV